MKAPTKIALVSLGFLLLFAMGFSLVLIVLFMAQTIFVRILIGASGVMWSILSIRYLWFRTEYPKLWKQWGYDRQRSRISRSRHRYPKYQELYDNYPNAILHWERHCLHHNYSIRQMVDLALQVSNETWAEREQHRLQIIEERRAAKESVDRSSGSLV